MFELFRKKNGNYRDDILSGLTVAFALVPEAIAFSMIINVNPIVGLWSAVFLGMITALFGGRPGMISGATGAIAVVLKPVFDNARDFANANPSIMGEMGINAFDLGSQFMFITIILAGCMQVIIGLLKFGRFIRLVPHSVMMGFVNGLAIVIGMAQVKSFMNKSEELDENGKILFEFMSGIELWGMIGLVILTMAIIQYLPKLTRKVPSSLMAIIIIGVLSLGINKLDLFSVKTVGDFLLEASSGSSSQLAAGFPTIANFSCLYHLAWMDIIRMLGLTIAVVCFVGLIESLMTLQLIDEITETRGEGNRECLAQGGANIASGLFGGMGGCAMIGQSLINIKSGGRGRTSGFVGAFTLMLFILVGGPLIVQIPIAALTGVMFMVVIGTFDWVTFKTFGKVPFTDIFVIILVTVVTVWIDLAVAVFAGVIASALIFAWQSSKHVKVEIVSDSEESEERIYALEGLIYFGSVKDFSSHFQASIDRKNVIIDFEKARVCDLSGLEAINAIASRYKEADKNLKLRHLSPDCRSLLSKAGSMVVVEILPDDPSYSVARIKADTANG